MRHSGVDLHKAHVVVCFLATQGKPRVLDTLDFIRHKLN